MQKLILTLLLKRRCFAVAIEEIFVDDQRDEGAKNRKRRCSSSQKLAFTGIAFGLCYAPAIFELLIDVE